MGSFWGGKVNKNMFVMRCLQGRCKKYAISYSPTSNLITTVNWVKLDNRTKIPIGGQIRVLLHALCIAIRLACVRVKKSNSWAIIPRKDKINHIPDREILNPPLIQPFVSHRLLPRLLRQTQNVLLLVAYHQMPPCRLPVKRVLMPPPFQIRLPFSGLQRLQNLSRLFVVGRLAEQV